MPTLSFGGVPSGTKVILNNARFAIPFSYCSFISSSKIDDEITGKYVDALIREIKEELELDINNLEYLTTVEYDYPNFHLTMHCFICKICGGSLNLNAHNDAKYVKLEELSSQNLVPADVDVVEKLLSF